MSRENPHDGLFRFAFSRPATAEAHFRASLSAEVVQDLRWDTLQLQPGSFVDPALAQFHSDLLYRVELRGRGHLYLYLLFEHQSRPDALMPLRLYQYLGRIWQRWLDQNDEQLPLPYIVPLLLYNGDRAWNVPEQFQELFHPRMRETLQAHLPAFTYVLQDLSEIPEEDLRGEVLRQMTLLWLKGARDPNFHHRPPEFLDALRQVLTLPDGLQALEALLRYLFLVVPRPMTEPTRALLTTALTPQIERWWMSWADQLEQEALERGRKAEHDRLLGKIRRQLLLSLKLKFGELPADIVRRVQHADEEELDRLAEHLSEAPTLTDLFS
jgi:hypothetical protein